MLRKQTKGKQPAVKETSYHFKLAGGDQCAESGLGHIKSTMRRVGNIGRLKVKTVRNATLTHWPPHPFCVPLGTSIF